MKKINKEQAVDMMKKTNGSIFSVVFTKKDGTDRHMNCRTGVKKNLKGVGLAFDPTEKGLLGVYDMQSGGYRFINLNAIKAVQINHTTYVVEV